MQLIDSMRAAKKGMVVDLVMSAIPQMAQAKSHDGTRTMTRGGDRAGKNVYPVHPPAAAAVSRYATDRAATAPPAAAAASSPPRAAARAVCAVLAPGGEVRTDVIG